nr:hypothetical protein [Mesorhizobium sp.]
MLPIIASIQQSGITSLRGLAIALNNRGVRTARNGQWQVSNVRNIWGGKLLQTCFYRRENALNLKRFPHAHEYSCQVTAIFPLTTGSGPAAISKEIRGGLPPHHAPNGPLRAAFSATTLPVDITALAVSIFGGNPALSRCRSQPSSGLHRAQDSLPSARTSQPSEVRMSN